MAHFLLIYDRDLGRLVRQREFDDAAAAIAGRFDAEAEFADRPQVEIVAVTAGSEDELRATHGRYFLDLAELASRFGE